MIPLVHDFDGETVLVFGGGRVGARKARRFAAEARTVVISPAFADADFGAAERVRAAPDAGDAADWIVRTDPALVVTATDDAALNGAVADAAREAGTLYNRADRAGSRDARSVVVPATVEDGPVRVAVSTGASSPALAKHLRERIEADLEGAGAMAELTGDLRERLKREGVPAEERREAIRAVVRSSEVWKGLRTGMAKARQEAIRVIREHRGELP